MSAPLKTVKHVEINRYLGTWFEIFRLPIKYEDVAARDITATYSLNENGSIKVDNRCIDKDGQPAQAVGEAKPVDASNARLTVSFLPEYLRWIPYTKGDYWIIRLDDDYKMSLVGTPDRKYLWLLAREHDLAEDVRDDYMATARDQGFDLTQMITPLQSGNKVKIAEG